MHGVRPGRFLGDRGEFRVGFEQQPRHRVVARREESAVGAEDGSLNDGLQVPDLVPVPPMHERVHRPTGWVGGECDLLALDHLHGSPAGEAGQLLAEQGGRDRRDPRAPGSRQRSMG